MSIRFEIDHKMTDQFTEPLSFKKLSSSPMESKASKNQIRFTERLIIKLCSPGGIRQHRQTVQWIDDRQLRIFRATPWAARFHCFWQV